MVEATSRPIYFSERAAFRAWAFAQPRGRFERIGGEVIAMSPERAGHARIKASVWEALKYAIREAGVPCEALPDGMTVEVDETSDFEPDALVNCGERLADDQISAVNPVVVVEVLSPSTKNTDTGAKLAGYFRVPSIQHYLIVNPRKPEIVHHRRSIDDTLLTKIVTSGVIELDPPGIQIALDNIYETLA